MWNFSQYGTHIPVLCRAFIELRESTGDVLELGCGDFSTPVLHELCANRKLLTLDNDALWLERFSYLYSPQHIIKEVSSWDNLEEYNLKWDIVFVDQNPPQCRNSAISALADKSKLLIIHDTEEVSSPGYNYDLSMFKFSTSYKWHIVETTVVSNFIDVAGWWK